MSGRLPAVREDVHWNLIFAYATGEQKVFLRRGDSVD